MAFVGKIKGFFSGAYRTTKRYAGATMLGLGVAAGTAAIPATAYFLLRDNASVSEPAMVRTHWTENQLADWNSWKADFLTCLKSRPDVCFVKDSSQSNQVVSEGMAFGLLMSLQMNDQQTFNGLVRGLSRMTKHGLPVWRAYLNGEDIHVRNDRDRASASDADQDIAYALVQANQRVSNGSWSGNHINYGKLAQHYLNLIWENGVQYDGRSAILKPSEDWGGATGISGVTYNVSYASPAMYEAFQSFDANPNHAWRKLMEDTITLRGAIINARELRTGRKILGENGELIDEMTPINGIPDWVAVAWTEKGIELYTPEGREARFGYDAVRTLTRLALDIHLIKDPTLRQQCIEQAHALLKAVEGKNIPEDIEIFDPIFGKTLKNKEIVLATYAVLAEAVDSPLYGTLKQKLDAQRAKHGYYVYPENVDPEFMQRYFDRTLIWMSLGIAEGGWRDFYRERFNENESKELQQLRGRHNRSYGLMLEYLEWPSPQERAELEFMKRVLWFDESEYLPSASESREIEMRLQRAGEAMSLRYMEEAARQYIIVLETARDVRHIREALDGLMGTMEKVGLLPDTKLAIFEELLDRNIDNPYLELGKANCLLETYRLAAAKEAIEITDQLMDEPDNELAARATLVFAQAKIRVAEDGLRRADAYYENFESTEAREELKQTSLNAFNEAIEETSDMLERGNISSATRSLLYVQLAGSLYSKGKNLKDIASLEEANYYYQQVLSADLDPAEKVTISLAQVENLVTLAKVRTGVPDYNLTLDQISALKGDAAFVQAQNLLTLELARVSSLDTISELQLRTKRISLYNLISLEPLAAAETDIAAIIGTAPRNRLRGDLERILFFVNSGQSASALADIESLLLMIDHIENPARIPGTLFAEQTSNDLRNLIVSIRAHQRGETEDITPLFQQASASLAHYPHNSKLKEIRKAIDELIDSSEEARIYEDLVILLQRALEEDAFLKDYLAKPTKLRRLVHLEQELSEIGEILERPEFDLAQVATRLEELIGNTNEASVDADYYEKFVGSLQAISWVYFNSGHPTAAQALLLEILEKEHEEPTGSGITTSRVLNVIRDKENRGHINTLLSQNPALRTQILADLGDMFKINGNLEAARKVYCEILGIDPELKGTELKNAINIASTTSSLHSLIASKLDAIAE